MKEKNSGNRNMQNKIEFSRIFLQSTVEFETNQATGLTNNNENEFLLIDLGGNSS